MLKLPLYAKANPSTKNSPPRTCPRIPFTHGKPCWSSCPQGSSPQRSQETERLVRVLKNRPTGAFFICTNPLLFLYKDFSGSCLLKNTPFFSHRRSVNRRFTFLILLTQKYPKLFCTMKNSDGRSAMTLCACGTTLKGSPENNIVLLQIFG